MPLGVTSTVAVLQHVASGAVKVLAVTSTTRSALLPQVPTMAEAGLPGYEFNGWYGMYAPPGMPAALTQLVYRAVQASLARQAIGQRLVELGVGPGDVGAGALRCVPGTGQPALGGGGGGRPGDDGEVAGVAEVRRRIGTPLAAGDVLASLTTMVWNAPSKSWTGGATMADASLNRRMTVRLGDAVAFAQIGIVGLDGQIELEALRLYGLPEAAPALLCGTPDAAGRPARVRRRDHARPAVAGRRRRAPGRRRRWPAPGRATAPRRRSPPRRASSSSTPFAWSNNTVRVLARNISGAAFDLGAATLSVAVTKRRIP